MGILSNLRRKRPIQPEGMWKISKGTEVQLGQPQEYPTELVTRLKMFFLSAGQVERAYLVEFYDPRSGEPPHNLIGIVMKTGAAKRFPELAPEIGAVIKQATKEGEFFDMMDLSTAGQIGDYITKSTKPFYP